VTLMIALCCYARCILVAAIMFLNQKFFLDVKDRSKLGQLEATIRQLGGTVEKFLSKDVTCVVTNRVRTEDVLLQKDVSASASTQSQSFRPSASCSRVMSRGQTLLMHSNSVKDSSVCEPVAFAEMWGIKIVTLDTIVQAIDRQLHACSPSSLSSPATKQPVKSQSLMNKTRFVGAFVKVEDTESNFRPFFSQYVTFPRLDLDGDLSNGIFKCAESIRPVAVRKNVSTPAASTRKQQKVWNKRGYCECCDTMYDDLSQHLSSRDHQRFVENVENFASLDKLIDQICSSDGIGMPLPAKNYCTQDVADKKKSTECADETQLSNCNDPSTTAVVKSASHHNGCLRPLTGQHDKPVESDKGADTVEKHRDSNSISREETGKYNCRSLLPPSSGVNTHSVNSENHNVDADTVNNVSRSPIFEVHCNAVVKLSTSAAVTLSVDSQKMTESLCNVKSRGVFDDGNSDDMPQFISSDCVVNLLELLTSENSVDSAVRADEARSGTEVTNEKNTSVTPTKSLESSHVSAVCTCSSDTVCDEILPCEPDHCQSATSANVSAEYSLPLMLMQTDSLDMHCNAGLMEQCHAVGDKLGTNCELISNTSILPNLSDVLFVPPTVNAISQNSLMMNNDINHNDASSCHTTVDCDVSVLQSSSAYVHQPTTCSVPVYASSDINNSPVFGDMPLQNDVATDSTLNLHNKLPAMVYSLDLSERNRPQSFSSASIASDIIPDCFELHDKLLTMCNDASDIAEHDKQPNCSSSSASFPCSANFVAASTSVDNILCLPLTFSPPLCLSDVSAPPVDRDDASLRTPVHSPSLLLESPATFSSFSADISTELASCYQSSPTPCFSYLAGSSDVNDSLQTSLPCAASQSNTTANTVTNKQTSACPAQDKHDLQIGSHLCRTFDTERKCNMTVKCTSLHGTESFYNSSSADTALLETRLVDSVSCCQKRSIDVVDSVMSPCSSLSLQSEVNSIVPESYDGTEPVRINTDNSSDSACTMVYSYDCSASFVLQHGSDDNKTEPTVDYIEPAISNANSRWKVIFCDDCHMRLVRTEAVLQAAFDPNDTKVESKSCVLGPELHCISEPVDKAVSDNYDGSVSTMVNSCDTITSSTGKHVADRLPCKNETNVDQSVTNSTWEVILLADCRMKFVRSKAAVSSAVCVQTVSSDSRHCYANKSCNAASALYLLNVANSVITC